MTLHTWMKKNGWSGVKVAAHLDVTPQAVTNYITGLRTPRTRTIAAIEKMTRGKVQFWDWVN